MSIKLKENKIKSLRSILNGLKTAEDNGLLQEEIEIEESFILIKSWNPSCGYDVKIVFEESDCGDLSLTIDFIGGDRRVAPILKPMGQFAWIEEWSDNLDKVEEALSKLFSEFPCKLPYWKNQFGNESGDSWAESVFNRL